MLIEIAISISASWLWGKLADSAESIDKKNAIKKALDESIHESYKNFQAKYQEFSEIFFDQEFLKKNVCPEIHSLLTRHQQPDIKSVSNALPVNAILVSGNGFYDEIKDFFDMVMDGMKQHAALQEIINTRQIEETNQKVKELQETQKSIVNLLDDGFEKINFGITKVDKNQDEIYYQNTIVAQEISNLSSQLNEALPKSKGNELNKLLSKQLDRTRDFINNVQVNDAYDLLKSLEDEIRTSDDYTRFRWHTNIAACFIANNNRQRASEEFFIAYNFAKDEEKAVLNRVRAFLLIDKFDEALIEVEKYLEIFPKNGELWALFINTKQYLNEEFDENRLSEDLKNDNSVLISLSHMLQKKREYEKAFDLVKKAYKQDNSSFVVKRTMLSHVLSWVLVDNLKSYYKQFSHAQVEALKYTINSFSDLLEYLQNIQSKHVLTEVVHNYATAAELLGEESLRKEVITIALSLYPKEPIFIWHKIKELKNENDIDGIKKLTNDELKSFDKTLLFSLAEISSNNGYVEWNEKLLSLLNEKSLNKKETNELIGLRMCAVWKSGDTEKALSVANDNLEQIHSYAPLKTLYIRMLHDNGCIEERDKLLESCKHVSDNLSSVDFVEYADLLYDFGSYFDASNFYEFLVDNPSDDYLTLRYLNSLLNSDQRAKVKLILDSLPKEIRRQSHFKQIEANLARVSGDLNTLVEILEEELKANPKDSGAAAGYLVALYRKNKVDEIIEYLSGNPTYEPLIENNEIEIAKFQMEYGFQYEAMTRMYKLFRLHPTSTSIAGHYLLLMLLLKKVDILNLWTDVVSPSTAVVFEVNGYQKTIVIEPEEYSQDDGWPECVNKNNKLAQKLMGFKVNDTIEIDIGLGAQTVTIIKVESIFNFASNMANKIVSASVSSVGPVWSINILKENGEYEFSQILERVKLRKKYVENIFNVYQKKHFPLSNMAEFLGTDVISLILEWPYSQYDMFVCNGKHEEREKCLEIINTSDKPYILDLSALAELHRHGILESSLLILGKPLITSTLKDQLLNIIQIHGKKIQQDIQQKLMVILYSRIYLKNIWNQGSAF